jgi:hypothetical protein
MFIHSIQLQIALASIELLSEDIGARFVYSTCSLNPLEDEAVVCSILREHGDTLRLVDIKAGLTAWEQTHRSSSSSGSAEHEKLSLLSKFKYHPGINYWRTDVDVMVAGDPGSEDESDEDEDADEMPNDGGKRKKTGERKRSIDKLPPLLPSMMPPMQGLNTPPEPGYAGQYGWPGRGTEQEYNLNRAVRVFPHDQDTGGFFIAVFERYATRVKAPVATSSSQPAEHASQAPTATEPIVSTNSGVAHSEELNVLRHICGFNPKQISGLREAHDSTAGGVVRSTQQADLALKKWRQDCNVYKYAPMNHSSTAANTTVGSVGMVSVDINMCTP